MQSIPFWTVRCSRLPKTCEADAIGDAGEQNARKKAALPDSAKRL